MILNGYTRLTIIASLIIVFLKGATPILGQTNFSDKINLVAEDAAWCWYSDPRAVYHKGEKEAIYYGFINSKGDVVAKSMDLSTGEESEFILHEKLQVDDHNVPAFLFLPDGKILTFYNHHNGNIFMRKSKSPEDIDEWEDEVIILQQDKVNRYCYVNPIMLSDEDNRIYLFGRNIVRNEAGTYTDTRIYCVYSDDYGETWSKEVNLLYNEGRNNPQYIKYASDNKSRIDFLFTNGHPKLGEDVSVFHMYYEDGYFRQTNGEEICDFEDLPVPIKDTRKVYDAEKTGVRGWIWDIALDKKNRPVVAYTRYPDKQNHEYHYSRWNGKRWIDTKIVNSGSYITIIKPGKKLREAHYSGGIVLDHNNPRNVYLSRTVNGKFEISKCKVSRNGKFKLRDITTGSDVDNVRPYVVHGNPTGKPIVMWMSGHYYHYTDYDTDLMLKID